MLIKFLRFLNFPTPTPTPTPTLFSLLCHQSKRDLNKRSFQIGEHTKKFLWGGEEGVRKIPWVSQENCVGQSLMVGQELKILRFLMSHSLLSRSGISFTKVIPCGVWSLHLNMGVGQILMRKELVPINLFGGGI